MNPVRLPGAPRHAARRRRLRRIVLVLVPAVVGLGYLVGTSTGLLLPPDRAAAVARGEALQSWFLDSLERARSVAIAALRDGTVEIPPATTPIDRRVEGVGRLEGRHFLAWDGIPPEPDPWLIDESTPSWTVRLDGVHTRLIVRSVPDGRGHRALASFVIDSRLAQRRFAALLPRSLTDGLEVAVEFRDTHAAATAGELERTGEVPATDADRVVVPLRSPDGTVLARATLELVDRAHAAGRLRDAAIASTVAIELVLLLVLFRWRRIAASGAGLAGLAVALAVGRAALLWTRAPSLLLPREIGSASSFGSYRLWGLAGSPADLVLTALAAYLLALGLRDFAAARRRDHRATALTVACVGALGMMLLIGWFVRCLADNTSLPLFDKPGWWSQPIPLVLGSALVLAAIGSAELVALVITVGRRRPLVSAQRASRLTVALLLIVVLVPAGFALEGMKRSLELERIRSEFVPLVRDQSARRSVALTAAVRRVSEVFDRGDHVGMPVSSRPDFMAYRFWVDSELFFSGFQSSLSFFNPSGELVSHFGFEIPALAEAVEYGAREPGELVTRSDPFQPVAAVREELLHAEIPVYEDDRFLGALVGHVVDEPSNLPFLPWVRPYLAALGPGAPYGTGELAESEPAYVLYDAPGTVVISTLDEPPAMTDALVQAMHGDGTVEITAGGARFVGLGVQDARYRLHLLLIQVPGPIHRLASAARLILLGIAWLAAGALVTHVRRGGDLLDLVRAVRGSFYRKLLGALVLASMVPPVGLGLFLKGYVDQSGREALQGAATRYAAAAQRVLDDYAATWLEADVDDANLLDDDIVDWLRNVIGQEIVVYENGVLQATSKRELFSSGLLLDRLDGQVHRRLGREGLPFLVVPSSFGPTHVPVAYAPVEGADPLRELVVAVPMITTQLELARASDRVADTILLSTVLLVGLLMFVAALVARTVARPLRELVGATSRIATGDYATRLEARTGDEVAELVRGFNSMANSLATQRADLERRREYMETLLQHATTGVVSVTPDGTMVTLNPAARELLARGDERPQVGQRLADYVARSPGLEPLEEVLSSPVRGGERAEVDLERDGEPRRLRLVRVDLPDPAGGTVGRLILLDDVTELMRSNQLAAWAEMARAIAHEIKNPLTPIQLSTEHLARLLRDRELLPDESIEACLETVMKQVRTLYEIAGEFSAYAKLPALDPQPVDPVEFMRGAAGPYRNSPPEGLAIEERYRACGRAAIDAKVLTRAVVNLIENALHAMPDGGVLALEVGPGNGSGEIALTVADTGIGLSTEARKRLFEPYFSTKSSGTGLGLAIARRAVEAHHGRIEVERGEPTGTVFRIVLPSLDGRL